MMRKQIQVWGARTLAVVVLAVGGQHWGVPLYKKYFTPKKTAAYIPTTKVQQGQFVISFHEIGNLQAEKSVFVTSEVNGKVIDLVDDGKVVKAGDKLVELDTSDLERDIRSKQLDYQNAQADVKRAQAELEILKETNRTEVEQAEDQLSFDKTERERSQSQLEKKKGLANDKLIPRSEVDQAELDVLAKELTVSKGEKALTLKRKEVESKEQQKQADVRNVQFRADIAKFNLEEVEGRVKKAIIYAPAPGLVVISSFWSADGRRKFKEGDNVNPMQTVCELPDLSSMQVKIQVGESDAPKVKIGMKTLLRLDAAPAKVYHGVVKDISSLATEASPWDSGSMPGRKNFEVTVAVKETDRKVIKPGMSADVEFICDQVSKAMYIPLESVVEKNGKTFVYVKKGKKFVPVLVKLGKQNDNFACVLKNLHKGDVVALRDPTRPLDEQEAGKDESDDNSNDKNDKSTAPMPVSQKKK